MVLHAAGSFAFVALIKKGPEMTKRPDPRPVPEGLSEPRGGRHYVHSRHGGGLDQLEELPPAREDLEEPPALVLCAYPRGGGGLGVKVHKEDLSALFPQGRGEVHGGGGFAGASLLIHEGEGPHFS